MKYYHIHQGAEASPIENHPVEGTPLFFSRKGGPWYEMKIAMADGYSEYEIEIPARLFTSSFNPKKPKIVKITRDTKKKYDLLKRKYKGHNGFIAEMKKRNIIGIDATTPWTKPHPSQEGYIWSFKDIKITRIK